MKLALRLNRVSGGTKRVGDIPIAILCLLIVISETPILLRNVPNVVFYGLVALFFLFTARFYLLMNLRKGVAMALLLLYLGMLGMYRVLRISDASLAHYSTIVRYYFMFAAMLGISEYLTPKQKKTLLIVTALAIGLTMLTNMRLFLSVGASRFSSLFRRKRFTTNAVQTAYVSALMLLEGILFVVFLHRKRGFLKYAALACSILCLLFDTFVAQRMITLALSVLMYPLLLLYNARRTRGSVAFRIILFAVIVLFLLNASAILSLLEQTVGSHRLSIRISQIRQFLEAKNLQEIRGSLASRLSLMWQSVQSWLSSRRSFFLGVGDHRADNTIIGNHSHFLDELGRYGLVGALIWIPLFHACWRQIILSADAGGNTRLTQQARVLFFVFLLRGMVGSILEVTIGIQMFMVLPLTFSLLAARETKPDQRVAQEIG